ncbi:hypothetical protein [Pyrococcus yayanosii]|uniref:Uncharacterized protein n=1 Tax=Pyrococcus yayanosii (strain CH1 / JCM 16557) TaxID=529709 RepID=F8AHG7_PYRYC|nr:hypothetical protein [Pyrococcus yayanosii]AEH24166.1 hypothetical protein PYCH_04760 [Pyrococcus yayanosii CH1]
MDEVLDLLRAVKVFPRLNPRRRVQKFFEELRGDYVQIYGFLLLRRPPCPGQEDIEYLISPLSPGELERSDFRGYAVVRIGSKTIIKGLLKSGHYVIVRGRVEPYPCGNMRVIVAEEIAPADYAHYWALEEYALSKGEIEDLISRTFYATRQVEEALTYSLFGGPEILGNPLGWREGFTFSVLKDDERVVKSIHEFTSRFLALLPRELRLEKAGKWKIEDEGLGLDFTLFDPNTSLKYYSPTPNLLRRAIPVPKWAMNIFARKAAIFLISKLARPSPRDYLASLSETPFILNEPVAFEMHELEELWPNLVATIFMGRVKIGTLNPLREEVEEFRKAFERWLWRNREEYGEILDALLVKNSLLDVGRRYVLSLHVLGSMSRIEGRLRGAFVRRVLAIEQEILDTWINEVPREELISLLRDHRRYVGEDRRASIALRVFLDLEATSVDGTVTREEFVEALLERGLSKEDAEILIERLKADGYIYEPILGRLRMVRPE